MRYVQSIKNIVTDMVFAKQRLPLLKFDTRSITLTVGNSQATELLKSAATVANTGNETLEEGVF
jgi:hypothetical protein